MRSFRDLDLGAIRRQHPHRNFQSPSRWVDDRDRAVSPLRSADDLKGEAMERMERVEDPDMRGFCAQGIVGVGGTIPTSIASCRAAESPPMARGGSPAAPVLLARAGAVPPVPPIVLEVFEQAFDSGKLRFFSSLRHYETGRPSAAIWIRCEKPIGSCTPSRPSPDHTSAGLRRPLHPSRGHLQSTPARHRRRPSEFSLERLSGPAQPKTMTLSADEFIRRFLLHVLPKVSSASATTVCSPASTAARRCPCAANSSPHRSVNCSPTRAGIGATSTGPSPSASGTSARTAASASCSSSRHFRRSRIDRPAGRTLHECFVRSRSPRLPILHPRADVCPAGKKILSTASPHRRRPPFSTSHLRYLPTSPDDVSSDPNRASSLLHSIPITRHSRAV